MISCWLARKRLEKIDIPELTKPRMNSLRQHLTVCPACDSLRKFYVQLHKDMMTGATFEARFELPFNIKLSGNEIIRESALKHMLRRLDWLLMPERTLKWAVPALMVCVAGAALFNQPVQKVGIKSGFSNNLVISRGQVHVTVGHEQGLHIFNSRTTATGALTDQIHDHRRNPTTRETI